MKQAAAAFLVFAAGARAVEGPVVNPADKQLSSARADSAATRRPTAARKVVDPETGHHSWELPAIVVHGMRPGPRDEELVGAAEQPRWTAKRPFGETRVYVIPEGQFEFEYWLKPAIPRHGDAEIESMYEFEMGLSHRLQLDLYVVAHKAGKKGSLGLDEQKLELRWALARWGVIPANPTIYLEWVEVHEAADHVEGKLLLGGGIVPRWHWGANLVFEHEAGGKQEDSKEITAGVSYGVIDGFLTAGMETKLAWIDEKGNRGDYTREFLLGPSLQYRPVPRMHVDVAPLLGLNDDSPRAKGILVLGWEF